MEFFHPTLQIRIRQLSLELDVFLWTKLSLICSDGQFVAIETHQKVFVVWSSVFIYKASV